MPEVKIPVTKKEITYKLKKLGLLNSVVRLAMSQAEYSHKKHKATGGEPFLEYHLYPVVYTLVSTINEVDQEYQHEAVAIAFLHDVIEDDPAVDAKILAETFTTTIVSGVVYLTREKGHDDLSDEEKLKLSKPYIEHLMSAPHHVRLVKLADRAVNLQNNLRVGSKDNTLRLHRIINETESLFLPLAKKTSHTYLIEFKNLLAKLKDLDSR